MPEALIGGGWRSKRPTLFQMWLIQWAPGASLLGWTLAALGMQRIRVPGSSLAFGLLGMMTGAALWVLIAVCSLPLFLVCKGWIHQAAHRVTRWRGAAIATSGLLPSLAVAIVGWLALNQVQPRQRPPTAEWLPMPVVGVTLGLGTVVAAEMWTLVFGSSLRRDSPLDEPVDISFAVRVKEDLEVVRLLLANSAMAALSMLTAVLPVALVGLLILARQQTSMFGDLRLVSFVPLAIVLVISIPLVVLASYQIGLWYFLSVRTAGVLLFVVALALLIVHVTEPVRELSVGPYRDYTLTAWVYILLLSLLTIPGLVVIASLMGMSVRLARLSAHLDSVVRGWRAWPTNVWAPVSRTLCLPSFLVALPRRRFRPAVLFALVVILSALHAGLVVGSAMAAPTLLRAVFTSELTDGPTAPTGGLRPTVGAAITARSSDNPPAVLTRERILLAIPFALTGTILLAAVSLNRTLASRCLRAAQKRAAGSYQAITQLDTRAPILFLRSFNEEGRLLEPPARSLLAKVLRVRDRKRTLDEIVLDAASPIGPVVALGIPGEEAVPLGAARLYADDTQWQDAVRTLARRSRAVIICVEEGRGVAWELKYLLADGHAPRTLCILSPQTSSATLLNAVEESRESGNTVVTEMLEQVQLVSAAARSGKLLVGARFPGGVATPIFAEDTSDYTHWCMVNLLLSTLPTA